MSDVSIKKIEAASETLLGEKGAEDIAFRLIEVLTVAYEKKDEVAIKQITQFSSKFCLDQLAKNLDSSTNNICLFLLRVLNSEQQVIEDFFKVIDEY